MRGGARAKESFFLAGKCEERIYRGIWGAGGTAFAMGKIYIHGGRGDIWSEGDIVCIFERSENIRAPLFSPAGVIISASAVLPTLIDFLARTGIPYLILKEPFPEEYEGKVALLDTQRDILVIDPGIETLNDYAGSGRAVGRSTAELLATSEQTALRTVNERRGKGILVSPRSETGDVFELLTEIAESFCSTPITVSLSVPRGEREREVFCDSAEALFKAAVYGNFAVQLEDYVSSSDIISSLSLMHRVFCRLEEDGREISGYLRRGILISSPVWLMRSAPLSKADFICFDFDALTSRLFGRELSDLELENIPRDILFDVWRSYFSSFAPDCVYKARSQRLASTALFEEWAELAGIEEIYEG